MPVPLVAAGQIISGIGGLLGQKKPLTDRVAQFCRDNLAEIRAGNTAVGKGLNAAQFRASPAYAWMNDPQARPIMLTYVKQLLDQGLAQPKDFDPSIVKASGYVGYQSTDTFAGPVRDTSDVNVHPANKSLSTMATGPGVSLLTLGIILAVGLAAWWFFTRK
jgi:hypothetical protein